MARLVRFSELTVELVDSALACVLEQVCYQASDLCALPAVHLCTCQQLKRQVIENDMRTFGLLLLRIQVLQER